MGLRGNKYKYVLESKEPAYLGELSQMAWLTRGKSNSHLGGLDGWMDKGDIDKVIHNIVVTPEHNGVCAVSDS